MDLYVTAASAPGWFRTAERRPKTEIRMLQRKLFELGAVVQAVFVTDAEDQRQLIGLGMAQVIRRHSAKRRDACSGRNENSFLRGIPNHEKAKRGAHLHGIARLHRKKKG